MSDETDEPGKAEEKQFKEVPEKLKFEKLEKIEIKEKPEKHEHKEKPEKFEHKEKPEKFEHKEKPEKIEHKEIGKLEIREKIFLETNPKDIAEGPQTGDRGDPLEQRLSALEQTVTSLQHFISGQQRPDISRGALSNEPGTKKPAE